MIQKNIIWKSKRKFGFELEYMNKKTAKTKMANIVRQHGFEAEILDYCHSFNNNCWHCKNDASASIELATCVLSGWEDLKNASQIVAILKDNDFWYNQKCGFHVHVNISDFTHKDRNKLLMWWIKFENFIMNMFPVDRRLNHFCKMHNNNTNNDVRNLLNKLSNGVSVDRYVSLNIREHTAEFRFGNMSHDSEEIRNRIRFFIWIIESIKILHEPQSLSWNSPKEIMRLLGLRIKSNKYLNVSYSDTVNKMRQWALKSYLQNCSKTLYLKNIDECEQMLKEFEVNDQQTEREEVVHSCVE